MFLLNLQSKVPIYQQIQQQLIRMIEAGVLKPGDKLPSVRQLAMDNGINPNTVAKAYAELELSELVYNLPKKGVYVAEYKREITEESQVMAVLKELKDRGITKKEILDAAELLYGKE